MTDSALVDLCKWVCEVGQNELFPFDVATECEEIHTPVFPGFLPVSAPLPVPAFLGQRPLQGRRLFAPGPNSEFSGESLVTCIT